MNRFVRGRFAVRLSDIRICLFCACLFSAAFPFCTQTVRVPADMPPEETSAVPEQDDQTAPAEESSAAAVPDAYRGISLGMSVDEVKKLLTADGMFGYRGERDVSLLPVQERTLIETAGMSFLSRCWFQFYQDTLYTMIITMNPDLVDFYSVFKTLKEKYGEPYSLSPEKIMWKDEKTTMSLERPLAVKYVDNAVFETLQGHSRVEKAAADMSRQMFLDEF